MAIDDLQVDFKNIIFPIPKYPDMYILQNFNGKTDAETYYEGETVIVIKKRF